MVKKKRKKNTHHILLVYSCVYSEVPLVFTVLAILSNFLYIFFFGKSARIRRVPRLRKKLIRGVQDNDERSATFVTPKETAGDLVNSRSWPVQT